MSQQLTITTHEELSRYLRRVRRRMADPPPRYVIALHCESTRGSEARVTYEVTGPEDAPWWTDDHPADTKRLKGKVETQLAALDEFASVPDGDVARCERVLGAVKLLGADVASELLPAALIEFLRELDRGILQFSAARDWDWVPWELLSVDAGEVLAERFSVVRLPRELRRSRQRPLTLAMRPHRFVGIFGSGLGNDEAGAPGPMSDGRPSVFDWKWLSNPCPADALRACKGASHIYFLCHGLVDPPRLQVGEDSRLGNCLLVSAIRDENLVPINSFIFTNACWVSSPGSDIFPSLGRAFMEVGAGGFLGPIGPVTEPAARRFAEEFYEHFLGAGNGDPRGSMDEAQSKTMGTGEKSAVAYALYMNPRVAWDLFATLPDPE